jgi:hypothetical protein
MLTLNRVFGVRLEHDLVVLVWDRLQGTNECLKRCEIVKVQEDGKERKMYYELCTVVGLVSWTPLRNVPDESVRKVNTVDRADEHKHTEDRQNPTTRPAPLACSAHSLGCPYTRRPCTRPRSRPR